MAFDPGNCLTELDLLRRIYDEICDIRRRHAEIMADTANKKTEVSLLFSVSLCIILRHYDVIARFDIDAQSASIVMAVSNAV